MLFILIIVVFGFINFIAIFGNVVDRELKKELEYYKKIVGRSYE
jgi:hypothetical protein